MNSFPSSVRSLVAEVERALTYKRTCQALRLVHNFVERIITDPICTAQVFASRDLDKSCMLIGGHNLVNLKNLDICPLSNINDKSLVIYIVSRLQRSGGHSRLVQDFIRAQPNKTHLVLSTEVGGPSDKDYFLQAFVSDANVFFVSAPSRGFDIRLSWLQATLLKAQPEHTYLFNHHQDSVAVSAFVPELGLKGSFIHHGDHHLCLGVHLSHLTHVDLHPMGYHHCRDELGVHNRYLPLTFEDRECILVRTDFTNGGVLTTATAARSNKVEVPYYVSYLDTIPSMLKATGGKHIHIGRLTPWALHRVYSELEKQGIQKDRFVYIKWTPSVWRTLQEQKVDVYLASFPYGAGLTLIEAMGAGIPVIMHEHMYSRILSGLELAYSEAYHWSDPDDLLMHLSTLQSERLEYEKRLSRQQYERFHQPEILHAFLRDSDPTQLSIPQRSKNFRPRYDEWAAWIESQLSFQRLVYRFFYRVFRKFRGLMSHR